MGFDPTSGARVDEGYVRVAVGRDHTDAAPMRGHVIFAAPPQAHISPDPPKVDVAIAHVPSRDQPLGFTPDDPDLWAAPGPVAGRPPEGTTHLMGL